MKKSLKQAFIEYLETNTFDQTQKKINQYTEETLQQEKQHAFLEGYHQGKQEVLYSIEQNIALILGDISQQMDQITTHSTLQQKELLTIACDIALAICKKIFPLHYEELATKEVFPLIQTLIDRLEDKTNLLIEVHPNLVEPLQKYFKETSYPISIQANHLLELTDCRIYWENGEAERISHTIWEHLKEILPLSETYKNYERNEVNNVG
ncbi:MAG: hypothetical protein HYS39_01210 [Proteobacteria bacterium]|nr:hypothetical protein [Pseudomonadota bacterium]